MVFCSTLFTHVECQKFCLKLNEVQMMPSNGTNAQRSREWVELLNTSDTDSIDLTGFFIRTDGNNNVNNPAWLQDEIVTWFSRYGAVNPIDQVAGPLITNLIKIPPKTIAIVLTPSWNLFNTFQKNIPNNAIVLTLKNTSYWGANTFAPAIPNGLLYNVGDYVIVYDGSPLLVASSMIDSLRWNGSQGNDFSLQMDDDCIWRWHGSAPNINIGGHPKDLNGSILLNHTFGVPNFNPLAVTYGLPKDTLCIGDSTAYSFVPWACVDSIRWDFGDPNSGLLNTDTALSAKHIWNDTGTFTVRLFVKSACHADTITTEVLVLEPPAVNLGPDTVVCNGGSIVLMSNLPGSSYLWNTGDTLNQITITAPGTYSIVVDSFGCVGTDTALVGLSVPLPIYLGKDTTDCTGGPIPLDAGPGFATYLWSTGAAIQTQIVVASGIYNVTGTDTAGCKSFDTIDIKIGLPPVLGIAGTDPSCSGFGNGMAIVTANGLTPFAYIWNSTSLNQAALTGLTAGFYSVIVSDPIGCADSISIQINEPEPLTLSSWKKDETCAGFLDGAIYTTVSGGTVPYIHSWSNGSSSANLSALGPGLYTLNITDANGCNISTSVTINTKPSPVVTAFGNPNFCAGGAGDTLFSTVVNGTAPYYYTWWCDSVVTWCGLDSVFDNDPIAKPTASTWYYVQVIDNNGCPGNIDSVFVVVKPKPIVNAGPDVTICPDSAPCAVLKPAISAAPGPFVYQWSPSTGLNNATVMNPCARPDTTTIYTLLVHSLGNGCNSKTTNTDTLASVVVHVQPLPVATAHLPGPALDICTGDCVILQGFGSGAGPVYHYQWSPQGGLSNPNIANPQACPQQYTEYVLTVWSNGCPSYGDTVRIHVHGLPTADAGPDVDICPGESGQLHGQASGDPLSSGYSFLWSPSTAFVPVNTGENPFATSDTTLKIFLTAYSSWGCGSPKDFMTLHVKPAPQADAGPNLILCLGHQLQLQGSHYFFTNDTSADPSQMFFTWTPQDSLSNTKIPMPWAGPDLTTTYYLKLQYQNCESLDSMLLTVFPEIIASAIADTLVICEGDSIQLFGSGGIGNPVYQWLPSAGILDSAAGFTSASPPSSVELQLVVSEGGCSDTALLPVEVIPLPDILITGSSREGCVPHTISLAETGSNSIFHAWDFGDGTALSNEHHIVHTYPLPGTYQIKLLAINRGSCTSLDSSVIVSVYDTAKADFHSLPGLPAHLVLGNAVIEFADDSKLATGWFWDFGDGRTSAQQNPVHEYVSSGTYPISLKVTNDFGCLSSIRKGVVLVEVAELLIPNVFTPNGDGISDEFVVNHSGDQPFSLTVFDRWGVNHYSSRAKLEGWRGKTWNGDDAAEGVYYYLVTIAGKDFTGSFTLLR